MKLFYNGNGYLNQTMAHMMIYPELILESPNDFSRSPCHMVHVIKENHHLIQFHHQVIFLNHLLIFESPFEITIWDITIWPPALINTLIQTIYQPIHVTKIAYGYDTTKIVVPIGPSYSTFLHNSDSEVINMSHIQI